MACVRYVYFWIKVNRLKGNYPKVTTEIASQNCPSILPLKKIMVYITQFIRMFGKGTFIYYVITFLGFLDPLPPT